MTDAPCLRLAEESAQTPEMVRRLRRLENLQDQFHRAHRRAAGPFSHPFATHGSLSKLREQIRDVSRVADAVLLNSESASDHRIDDLCSDLKSLMMSQQSWTKCLENEIWRLESQASMMRQLQQLLLEQSPGSDRLWELCEAIARETQSLPSGLLLLPEPGHQVNLSKDHIASRASWSLEQARLAVFSGVTLLPDVRGSDIVAQTLQASSSHLLEFAGRDYDASVFAEARWNKRAAIAGPTEEMVRLIRMAGHVLSATEALSLTAADKIVPPAIEEFYGGISVPLEANFTVDADIEMAHAICYALGLPCAKSQPDPVGEAVTDDAAIVLTHKLRWHDGTLSDSTQQPALTRSPKRRPHFAATGPSKTSLTVFAREE